MSEASSTESSCHRARRSVSKSTKRSCGFCFAQCARRDESCGRTNHGCFTTTMHLLTTPSASGSSWPRSTSPYCNNLPVHPILLRVTFFLSPSSRGSSRGPVLKGGGHQEGRNQGAEEHPEESSQQCRGILPAVQRNPPRVQRNAVHRSVAEKDGKVH